MSERTRRWQHETLSVFGIGSDLEETAWRGVFRQLVALGLLRIDHEAHGAFKLTEESRPVLRGEQSVSMRETVRKAPAAKGGRRTTGAGARAVSPVGDSPTAQALLEALRVWRREEARTQSVPAYVILHDATLAEIARCRPADDDALGQIPGIGARKLERYGPAVLALVEAAQT